MPLNLHWPRIASSFRLLDDKFVRLKVCANQMIYHEFVYLFQSDFCFKITFTEHNTLDRDTALVKLHFLHAYDP